MSLVYPYFHPSNDNSIFRFPPLGLGYMAAYLKRHDISVNIVDCTFLDMKQALNRIRRSRPDIIGVQTMFSMKEKTTEFAKILRKDCEVLVAGGPLATSNPEQFLQDFDVIVMGEGEQTMLELVQALENRDSLEKVPGIIYKNGEQVKHTAPRGFIQDLDALPFPARDLFENDAYKRYYKHRFGYTTTSVLTSRGCPFQCDFCSRPVFGNTFRTRSASNIADEVEEAHNSGYERIWFADDCFTLDRARLLAICNELVRRRISVGWECLSRVDTVDTEIAQKMKWAGCIRVYFGIESGNNTVLNIMKKHATIDQAQKAVKIFKKIGVQTGAFFILGYPGENQQTILDTVNFASSLPLDYLSFTFPYPIPGTPLYDRVKSQLTHEEWSEPNGFHLVKHKLLFYSDFSQNKLKIAIFKGMLQHYIHKYLGKTGYRFLGRPAEQATEALYKAMP